MLQFKINFSNDLLNKKRVEVLAFDPEKNFEGSCGYITGFHKDADIISHKTVGEICDHIQLSIELLLQNYNGKPFLEDRLHESMSE